MPDTLLNILGAKPLLQLKALFIFMSEQKLFVAANVCGRSHPLAPKCPPLRITRAKTCQSHDCRTEILETSSCDFSDALKVSRRGFPNKIHHKC